jgi:urease accessory protein
MKVRPVALAVACWLSMIDGAGAHPALQGAGGFTGGLLHVLLVPSHVIAVVALGLLIGQQAPRGLRSAGLVYAAAVLMGLVALALAYAPTYAEEALLLSSMLCGLLVALARPMPQAILLPLATATGLALALDSPPDAISIADANLALFGTAICACILLGLVIAVAVRLRQGWQRIGLRIFGSWISASAILVLALRFAR